MAFDEQLARRVRAILESEPGLGEKRMFGGLCFLIDGNMCCGIVKDDLMLRVGPARHEAALARPHARAMDFTGRPMKGMVFVDPEGYRSERDLRAWIGWSLDFVRTLAPK